VRVLFGVLIIFVLSLSFAVPIEDASETAYDESESLPFQATAFIAPVAAAPARDGVDDPYLGSARDPIPFRIIHKTTPRSTLWLCRTLSVARRC